MAPVGHNRSSWAYCLERAMMPWHRKDKRVKLSSIGRQARATALKPKGMQCQRLSLNRQLCQIFSVATTVRRLPDATHTLARTHEVVWRIRKPLPEQVKAFDGMQYNILRHTAHRLRLGAQ